MNTNPALDDRKMERIPNTTEREAMNLFEVGEQLDDARAKLDGVCELLDCAAAAHDEIGAAGLELLAKQARQAYGDLVCGIGLLERAQEIEDIEMSGAGEEEGGDSGNTLVF